jgi:signal transduction histidine kinase
MKILQLRWYKIRNFFTLSRRIMLLVAGLLIILGFSQAALISIVARINIPQTIQEEFLSPTQLPPTVKSTSNQIDVQPTPLEVTDSTEGVLLQDVILRQVQSISLLMAGVTAIIGILGARWITQKALSPVNRLRQMVKNIQVDTLSQRVPLDGPPDQVKDLAEAFNHALERLEKAFEMQGRFVADASHEMRTPLATMRTNLEVLQLDPKATLSDYKEMSVTLTRTLDRLERLLNDLLLLARGELEVHKVPVNLEALLTEVVQNLMSFAKENHVIVNMKVQEGAVVLADERLLGIAFGNLIDNGIRYNRSGGSVEITVFGVDNGLTVQIQDTGEGIPSEELPRIFDRFYRVEKSRTRYRGGAGLGLAICEHIIKLHGGHIKASSTVGEGSNFIIWLPSIASTSFDPVLTES